MLSELTALSLGFVSGVVVSKKGKSWFLDYPEIPFSIGILEGESLLTLRPSPHISNPVFTAAAVTDFCASFVADPFLLQYEDRLLMFFEAMNGERGKGEICVAESRDGYQWNYLGLALRESCHLSYPYVFFWRGDYFMVPETFEKNSVELYRSTHFPLQWEPVTTLLTGADYVDSSVVHFGDRWWIFTSKTSSEDLLLFYADELAGPWVPHERNPVITRNSHIARPGGRMQIIDGKLFRFAQDDYARYGNAVRVFEVTELTPTAYSERAVSKKPLIQGTGKLGWNSLGMHHYDVVSFNGKYLAAVDGYGRDRRLRGLGWRVPWRNE